MQRNLAILNFALVAYFLFLYLVYIFNLDLGILEVIREMVTLPAMASQVVLIVLGIRLFIRKGGSVLFIFSLIALIICAVVTIGSFFW